ncbi:MAG TPA: ABC transporter permease [Candidatus Limnocylindrales bacterium]|nr:ABC transporter permease [Candidatus Limnocylindrales bacterium]
MRSTLVIATLVIREVLRRRLVFALLALTVLAVLLTAWGFSRLPTIVDDGAPLPEPTVKLIASQLLILVMFMFSNVIALSAVFVASTAISGEVESGVALALLSRPIARWQYVLGKWLGLAVLVAAYACLAAAVELAAVNAVVDYLPPRPLEFLAFLIAEGLVLLTLGLLLSTRFSGMVGGVVALVLFGMAWLGGIVGGLGSAFENAVLERVGTATKLLLPTDGLWRGAVYALEPAAVLAGGLPRGPASAANPFYATTPPVPEYIVWCALWLVGALALAAWSFSRREI